MSLAISVIIPSLNSPMIGEVLNAVWSQADELAIQWEAWVVGQDRYGQVQPDATVHLIAASSPVSPAQARNLGAAAAQGETLVFLDADCVPQPGWLAAMLHASNRWPMAGAISGAMLPDGDSFAMHCGQIAAFHEHLSCLPAGRRRTLTSFSMLVPRAVWQAIGGFDERYKFAAAEDLDFSIRIALRGYPLYFDPAAAVRHRPQRSGWRSLWSHALRGGSQSVIVRNQYVDYYQLPVWSSAPWMWAVLSPAIALAHTLRIYAGTPGLWRYWRCMPWVVISKLAWCWGATVGLARLTAGPSRESNGVGGSSE